MLRVIISILILSLLHEVAAQNESLPSGGCFPWPASLNKTLSECCIVPYHAHFKLERTCLNWGSYKMNGTLNITALELSFDCYANRTHIYVDGKFNKDVVKEIYKNYTKESARLGLGEDPWGPIIETVMNLCDFNPGKNLSTNLKIFYECVDDHLLKRCPPSAIDGSDECDVVDEYYQKCNKVIANCSEYPMRLVLPEYCCDYPEIVTPAVTEACRLKCVDKIKNNDILQCRRSCIDLQLNWKTNGKFNFEALKKLLMANANTSDIWRKSIELSIESCQKEIDESLTNEIQIERAIKTCLKETLSDNCVVFKQDLSCKKIPRYWSACPNTKPKRFKQKKTIIDHTTLASVDVTSNIEKTEDTVAIPPVSVVQGTTELTKENHKQEETTEGTKTTKQESIKITKKQTLPANKTTKEKAANTKQIKTTKQRKNATAQSKDAEKKDENPEKFEDYEENKTN